MSVKENEPDIVWYDAIKDLSDLSICKVLAKIEDLKTYLESDTVRVVVVDGEDY